MHKIQGIHYVIAFFANDQFYIFSIRPSLMQMKKVNDLNFDRDPENSLLLYPDISMKDTDPEIAALAYDEEETVSLVLKILYLRRCRCNKKVLHVLYS